ncbi:hypothetical protein BD413DRAFT_525182 [Trametes elegans]|nr:hypothetical protein BD413DRAFT_525182 [Trametes elegans]
MRNGVSANPPLYIYSSAMWPIHLPSAATVAAQCFSIYMSRDQLAEPFIAAQCLTCEVLRHTDPFGEISSRPVPDREASTAIIFLLGLFRSACRISRHRPSAMATTRYLAFTIRRLRTIHKLCLSETTAGYPELCMLLRTYHSLFVARSIVIARPMVA